MSLSDQPQPVVVLITGPARAGKDTLADGVVSGAKAPVWRIRFADALKEAADDFLSALDLYRFGSFSNDGFKAKHRDFLVSSGRFARSLDVDVFARLLCTRVAFYGSEIAPMSSIRPVVVVPDWRYLNELTAVRTLLGSNGWKVVTVEIQTAGVLPANDEEAVSLGEIRRSIVTDFSFSFAPGHADCVRKEGINLARELSI